VQHPGVFWRWSWGVPESYGELLSSCPDFTTVTVELLHEKGSCTHEFKNPISSFGPRETILDPNWFFHSAFNAPRKYLLYSTP
jgi:hypothetical protein